MKDDTHAPLKVAEIAAVAALLDLPLESTEAFLLIPQLTEELTDAASIDAIRAIYNKAPKNTDVHNAALTKWKEKFLEKLAATSILKEVDALESSKPPGDEIEQAIMQKREEILLKELNEANDASSAKAVERQAPKGRPVSLLAHAKWKALLLIDISRMEANQEIESVLWGISDHELQHAFLDKWLSLEPETSRAKQMSEWLHKNGRENESAIAKLNSWWDEASKSEAESANSLETLAIALTCSRPGSEGYQLAQRKYTHLKILWIGSITNIERLQNMEPDHTVGSYPDMRWAIDQQISTLLLPLIQGATEIEEAKACFEQAPKHTPAKLAAYRKWTELAQSTTELREIVDLHYWGEGRSESYTKWQKAAGRDIEAAPDIETLEAINTGADSELAALYKEKLHGFLLEKIERAIVPEELLDLKRKYKASMTNQLGEVLVRKALELLRQAATV